MHAKDRNYSPRVDLVHAKNRNSPLRCLLHRQRALLCLPESYVHQIVQNPGFRALLTGQTRPKSRILNHSTGQTRPKSRILDHSQRIRFLGILKRGYLRFPRPRCIGPERWGEARARTPTCPSTSTAPSPASSCPCSRPCFSSQSAAESASSSET